MEELDKLKKDWKKNEGSYPKFSEKELYAMLHKGSSSIVKWILIISILEFVFWLGLSFLLKDTQNVKLVESYQNDYFSIAMTVTGYAIILFFFCLFYNNYRKIKSTDNVRTLMSTILRTRKTVSYYIIANISFIIISSIILFIIFFYQDENLINALHKSEENGEAAKFYMIYLLMATLSIGVFILIIWLFYKLIYGLLLKRLSKNYEELKKLDF